jgi:lactoylglutathione lyase
LGIRIEHLAIWTKDLERLKEFYTKYFEGSAGPKYRNPTKNFESYFLSFNDGCRLELMYKPEIPETKNDVHEQFTGIIHFAISVGSKENVNALTERLRKDGYAIVGEPRTTGDGYYESVVLDPEGNRIEIMQERDFLDS